MDCFIENKAENSRVFGLSSMALHVLAMLLMLSDHLWGTVVHGNDWMTCIGRLAFPIFAFLTVEGFFHTKNLKRYMGRMLIFALISEIPFNLMLSGSLIYPFHQNVLWSFLISLGLMWINEKAQAKKKWWLNLLTAAGTLLLGWFLGLISFADYYQAGVMMTMAFYFFHGKKWWHYAGQLLAMKYINFYMGGMVYEFMLFGKEMSFPQQGFAIFALIPIWLYNGQKGTQSKWLKWFNYAFYPAHMLILWLLMLLS